MVARSILSRWFGAGFGLAVSVAVAADEPIPFAQLPPAVQKGIQAQLSTGKLGEIHRDEDNGEVTYSVEITRDGRTRDFTLDANGAVTGMEIGPQEAPMAVLKAVQQQVGQGAIDYMEKTIDDGRVLYDVEWTAKDGKAHSLSVLESGALESISVELEETSPAVNAAIVKEAGNGQLKEISKTFEDNAVYFDVTVTRNGKDREFTVTDSGKLDSRQVFLEELSPAVQSSIQRTVGQGKLLRIDEAFEKKKGAFPFEVESVVNGKPYNFSIGPKGAFLGVD